MAQKTIEKDGPAKPGMRIRENWLLLSLFRAAISNGPAEPDLLERLKTACNDAATLNRYGPAKMKKLWELAVKDDFMATYTTVALNKYSKDDLFDIDEHTMFLEAYSKGKLAEYVPLLIKKFRAMGFLDKEKNGMEYMLNTGLKKEERACVHAITEVLGCIYLFKAGKTNYKEVIENGKETMDAW
jgi:CRISPR/Cas system Type II protein with McrA/HNH and RuvC-like nuclease domain